MFSTLVRLNKRIVLKESKISYRTQYKMKPRIITARAACSLQCTITGIWTANETILVPSADDSSFISLIISVARNVRKLEYFWKMGNDFLDALFK